MRPSCRHGDGRWVAALLAASLGLAGCGGASRPGPVLDPDEEVLLADVQNQVFTPSCALVDCHTGPDPVLGLDLSAGATADSAIGVNAIEMPSLMRVEPFDALNSYLFMKVTGDPRILGDLMPAENPELNDADKLLIQNWIEQGANQ